MLSDGLETFNQTFYPLPSIHFCSLWCHSFTEHIRCYPKPPDTGGILAHAQAVDTRPTSLSELRPGIEAKLVSEKLLFENSRIKIQPITQKLLVFVASQPLSSYSWNRQTHSQLYRIPRAAIYKYMLWGIIRFACNEHCMVATDETNTIFVAFGNN